MKPSSFALALALVAVPGAGAAQILPPLPPPGSAEGRAALLGESSYEENGPIPPGARIVTRQRVGLIATGASFFGTAWFLSACFGSFGVEDDGHRSDWLFVPVLGPFVQAAISEHASNGAVTIMVFDGLVQATGLAMLIGGITHPVRSFASDGPRWSLLPSFGRGPGASLRVVF